MCCEIWLLSCLGRLGAARGVGTAGRGTAGVAGAVGAVGAAGVAGSGSGAGKPVLTPPSTIITTSPPMRHGFAG